MVTFNRNQPWNLDNLDHPRATKLLSSHIPDADGTRLESFGSGDFCIAFKSGNQVFRIARHPAAAAALRRETCVLKVIAGILPLSVPRLTYRTPRDCPPFTIHREIIGDVLTREIWENMPTFTLKKVAADLADFLRVLHSIPVGKLNCSLAQLDAATVSGNLRDAGTNTIYEFLEQDTRRQLDQTLKKWSLLSRPVGQRPALLHCDIGPGHVLYDPQAGKLTGVIDFGDIAIGDPARDFIYIYEDFGPVILGEVLRHYAGNASSAMMPAIRKWYLLEGLSWTIQKCTEQHSSDMHHGLDEIRRELETLADQSYGDKDFAG